MAVKLLHSKNEVEIKDNAGMATPKLPDSILCQDNDSKSQTTPENLWITLHCIQDSSKVFKVQ